MAPTNRHSPSNAMQAPASVQAVLAARIDRLPLDDKRLLPGGRRWSARTCRLRSFTRSPITTARSFGLGLTRLQAAEFLYETRLFPDLEYTFKHALTHEVAYGGVTARATACAARADRRRGRDGSTPTASPSTSKRLAHHAFRGGEWDKAIRYGREAAMKAVGRSTNREATAYVEQALDRARARLPESRQAREMARRSAASALYVTLLPLGLSSGRSSSASVKAGDARPEAARGP